MTIDLEDKRSIQAISNPFVQVTRLASYVAEAICENDTSSKASRSKTVKYGVSKTQTQEMTNTVGIEVSASGGFKLAEWSVTLNYQFTSSTSSSFTEFTENEVVQRYDVNPKTCTVMFVKHIYVRGARDAGSTILNEIKIAASNDVHLSGCGLP
ncbi:uncharacterized protein EAE98_009904 [Botrytis deweyae]|uniref:Uncharacterized protein n=1 Tax=Botrytis deweyae TaxID=2478750 RepID=A0ABQ7IA90_9HELO|nr:uncharacterized protein EAE98_009904 [Botrytis deweyae]KAF7917876.1 hypothetical protein EAE98_009904 [Botrytis deweyae]